MPQPYDLIVIGLGAMGSATAYHAARQGYKVLGLDAYERNHHLGSSHGRSRIIRESYAEGPQYVPLVQRAYKLWRNLEQESGVPLYTMTGGIYIGLPGSEIVTGVLRSAREHHLSCDLLTASEVMSRFPGFRVPEPMVGVYEPNSGVLDAQACVEAHLDLAARSGADIHHSEPVLRWSPDGDGTRVETASATYTAAKLVIAAGPWTSGLLADLSLPLTVWRVVIAYFDPVGPQFDAGVFPFYLLEVPEGTYYGLPNLPGQGLKAGRHDAGEVSTPQSIRRTVDASEVATDTHDDGHLHARCGPHPQRSLNLHLHDDPRRGLHHRPPPRPSPGGLRLRLLRARLQVLSLHRRGVGPTLIRGHYLPADQAFFRREAWHHPTLAPPLSPPPRSE